MLGLSIDLKCTVCTCTVCSGHSNSMLPTAPAWYALLINTLSTLQAITAPAVAPLEKGFLLQLLVQGNLNEVGVAGVWQGLKAAILLSG